MSGWVQTAKLGEKGQLGRRERDKAEKRAKLVAPVQMLIEQALAEREGVKALHRY